MTFMVYWTEDQAAEAQAIYDADRYDAGGVPYKDWIAQHGPDANDPKTDCYRNLTPFYMNN